MPRLPRFKRAGYLPQPSITSRDREIILLVARHRFLRSTHITALMGGSHQQILRRLQLLYHHGYLERPKKQLEYFHQGGSRPMIYGLGDKAGPQLKQQLGDVFGKLRWGAKNREVGRVYLLHAVLVSDVLVALELACRGRSDLRFISQQELFPTGIRWRVKLPEGPRLGVLPDAAFAIEQQREDGSTERVHFFLEADRGTMPIVREKLIQTSFRRKFLAYEATWAQEIHRQELGIHRFRMLTVGTSEGRLKALRDECCKLEGAKGLFLFLHESALCHPSILSEKVWLSPQQTESVSLLN